MDWWVGGWMNRLFKGKMIGLINEEKQKNGGMVFLVGWMDGWRVKCMGGVNEG